MIGVFSHQSLKTFAGMFRSNNNIGSVGTALYMSNGYQNSVSSQKHRRRPKNCGSKLISNDENELLFNLIGTNCVSLTAGVCQLFRADHGSWTKVATGVISLVKDFNQKIYCLRLFNLDQEQMTFQQILYPLFQAKSLQKYPQFLVFNGEVATYGLNCADESEAESIRHHLQKRYEQETKGNRSQAPGSTVGITSVGAVSHINNVKHLEENLKAANKKGKKKDKKQKIRKEDIGNPINFQHKAHIGWDQDGGFSQQMYDGEPMDVTVRNLIKAAGQNPDKMKADDIEFVYQFLEEHGEKPMPKRTTNVNAYPTPPAYEIRRIPVVSYEPRPSRPLPSLPTQSSPSIPVIPRHEQAPARPPPPPPPPSVSHLPPVPPAIPSNRSASLATSSASTPPPPPPPPQPPLSGIKPAAISSNAPPAPPPPPPQMNNNKTSTTSLPKATEARANLLAEIEAKKKLKHVPPPVEKSLFSTGKVADAGPDGYLEDIKKGVDLRHVSEAEVVEQRKSITTTQNLDGLAGALARALEKRRNQMNQSDSDELEDSGNEWEDD